MAPAASLKVRLAITSCVPAGFHLGVAGGRTAALLAAGRRAAFAAGLPRALALSFLALAWLLLGAFCATGFPPLGPRIRSRPSPAVDLPPRCARSLRTY